MRCHGPEKESRRRGSQHTGDRRPARPCRESDELLRRHSEADSQTAGDGARIPAAAAVVADWQTCDDLWWPLTCDDLWWPLTCDDLWWTLTWPGTGNQSPMSKVSGYSTTLSMRPVQQLWIVICSYSLHLMHRCLIKVNHFLLLFFFSLPAPWWGLITTRFDGAIFNPLCVSGTTGRIHKILTAFDNPVTTVEGNIITLILALGTPMTSQFRLSEKRLWYLLSRTISWICRSTCVK